MNSKQRAIKQQNESQFFNNGLWFLILFLAFAGTILNYYFGYVDWALRVAAAIPLCILLVILILQTLQGKKAWIFIKSARGELRKVVWPTRQETVQTTLVVVAMVIVTALFLWGVDTLFLWLISLLTGQRG